MEGRPTIFAFLGPKTDGVAAASNAAPIVISLAGGCDTVTAGCMLISTGWQHTFLLGSLQLTYKQIKLKQA